mmetsp:Transcript_24026/g.46751  ORF Transcript_24026/g.46751 Transcript_24026/m.46751 type:complete len:188 (+) Transcript_24026:435-998(+)
MLNNDSNSNNNSLQCARADPQPKALQRLMPSMMRTMSAASPLELLHAAVWLPAMALFCTGGSPSQSWEQLALEGLVPNLGTTSPLANTVTAETDRSSSVSLMKVVSLRSPSPKIQPSTPRRLLEALWQFFSEAPPRDELCVVSPEPDTALLQLLEVELACLSPPGVSDVAVCIEGRRRPRRRQELLQ